MSFHGLPRRSLDLGDPYYCECQKTGRLLAEALGLTEEDYLITFQSRFGKAEWLQPYTQATLEKLGREGTARVDAICPGFVADCLETLEEIAMECKESVSSNRAARSSITFPCVNERPDWMPPCATWCRPTSPAGRSPQSRCRCGGARQGTRRQADAGLKLPAQAIYQ
jgi:ferrochelatase